MTNVRANILIVDDQPDNLRTLSAILNGQGYKVRKAVSGAMALKAVHSEPPHLILLDIRMPDMDGYEVCAALKSSGKTQAIPIIFLSALSETIDKLKAFHTGGADYITKPFQAEEVLVRIKHQLTIQEQQRRLKQEVQDRCNAEALVRQLNGRLEQLVRERTAQLERSLEFEALLKRITDRVRDSLDEDKILQSAVQELAHGLNIECCRTEIYNTDLEISRVTHEYDRCPFSFMNHVNPINSSGLYDQLLQKQEMQFCEWNETSVQLIEQQQAILVCPIFDDYGLLGNLRLFRPSHAIFDELETRLVRQVANQCAIAIRQARLYQKTQQQVEELQRLNQLKDDFLSTISHELRSPIANIKMVVRLLVTMANQGQNILTELSKNKLPDNKVVQYLRILQNECERELHLIQDLLDLQHLNAGVYPLERSTVDLGHWIDHIVEPFQLITQNQQQTLEIHLAPNLPILVTDVACLKRILTELLNNASKYTPAGGEIIMTVSTTQREAGSSAQVTSLQFPKVRYSRSCPVSQFSGLTSLQSSNSYLLISVINTGVEIAAAECDRIFDKFYRIPSHDPWKHGGTGLGLALVKRIAEHLSGSIDVMSMAGQTCFTVELPVEPASSSEQPPMKYLLEPFCE